MEDDSEMKNELAEGRIADTDSALPDELKKFFERGGSSLLIKGAAGSGKTTLALTLLRALNITDNFLYASTRESPVQFLRDNAWIAESRGGLSGVSGKKQPDADTDPDVRNGFVDARLDEPTQLFERITGKLMDASSPFIVIDTWDAMQDLAENKALKTDARVLQTWAERAGATLVFTIEDPHNTTLDGLVEGILLLKQKSIGSRRLRELTISKLSGVKIENPSYFFTLNDAEFRTFTHYRPEDLLIAPNLANAKASHVTNTLSAGSFPMGYPELDLALGGGIPAGSVLSIEVDSEVNMRIPFLLLGRVIASFALPGKQVRIFPIRGLDRDFVMEFLRVSIPRSCMKHVSMPESPEENRKEKIAAGTTVLNILNFHGIEEASLRYYSDLARSSGGATIYVGKEWKSEDAFRSVSTIAKSRMKMTYTNGTLFLQSKIPFSQFFGLIVSRRLGIPEIELEPMV
jgi:KaiC/GvpD/RAD55 family RecA-like ATPase